MTWNSLPKVSIIIADPTLGISDPGLSGVHIFNYLNLILPIPGRLVLIGHAGYKSVY